MGIGTGLFPLEKDLAVSMYVESSQSTYVNDVDVKAVLHTKSNTLTKYQIVDYCFIDK